MAVTSSTPVVATGASRTTLGGVFAMNTAAAASGNRGSHNAHGPRGLATVIGPGSAWYAATRATMISSTLAA